jgi:tetratricopeptide (TPR) repeat protein
MSSILEGYNYDIFISYRQKDNKYDGWVTDFVDHLKKEIEATFKEEISVYFDINPHDGLLETHDVDASLTEKLKCLVFIPVISRTYCDPRSFAWEHEFKAFVEQASGDRFGLKIKLPNGNVASRVLPVRIHELDISDIKLCESVLGGVIRGVDFIYKEPGVNRPLTDEDDEKKNQTGAKYRNQINKTANAIKDIIAGLKAEPAESVREKTLYQDSWKEIKTDSNVKGLISSKFFSREPVRKVAGLIIIVLCVASAFALYRIINRARTGKSIAVFFSPEIKNDSTLKNICDVYTENTHRNFKALKNLSVRPRSAMLRYRDNAESLNTIWKDLRIKYFLYGNVNRNNNDIRVWIELTSKNGSRELWSKEYVWDKGRISQNSADIVQAVARSLKIGLTSDEIKQIESEPTKNAEANLSFSIAKSSSYDAWMSFNMANKYQKTISFLPAIQAYDKAIKEDSLFAEAYANRAIARVWGYYTKQLDSTHFAKYQEDIAKAGEINKDLVEIQIAQGLYYYYCKKDLDKALEFFYTAVEKNPGDYQPLFYIAMVYRRRGEWKESFKLTKRIIALNPQEALCLTNIGLTFTYFHNYDSALMFHQKAIDVMPAWVSPYTNKIVTLILKNGNTIEARALLDTAVHATGSNLSESKIMLDIYDGKYPDALKTAQKSDPADFKIKGRKYLFLANINSYLKNTKNAMVYYDSALVSFKNEIANNKDDYELHSCLGLAYAGKGDKENAISEGKKAIELIKYNNFDKSDMILDLARIYTMVGEYDQAVSTIDYLLQTPLNIPSCFSGNLLKIDPVWKPLISQPKYQSMLRIYIKN